MASIQLCECREPGRNPSWPFRQGLLIQIGDEPQEDRLLIVITERLNFYPSGTARAYEVGKCLEPVFMPPELGQLFEQLTATIAAGLKKFEEHPLIMHFIVHQEWLRLYD